MVWYRQVGAYWIAYDSRKALWECQTRSGLERWLRERGIVARWVPLTIAVWR